MHDFFFSLFCLFRLRLKIQLELEGQDLGAEHVPHGHGRWPEIVDDLWQERLPHLRQEVYGDGMFMFDPTTGRYGFQEDTSYRTGEDGFMTDLMNEPEYGEGERRREGKEGREAEREGVEKADSIGGLRDMDDSIEELDETEALEPTISHSFDLDQASGDEEEKERGGTSASFLDKEDRKLVIIITVGVT